MTQIKLKLTQRELSIITVFLEQVIQAKPISHLDKMINVCLAEILLKLKVTGLIVKEQYSLKIHTAWGLALVHFCTHNTFRSPSEYKVVINRIISLIDQKTV